ncbi:MAG TPA: discoidin domain-containing protein [Bacteroidales bacterium]|mgnify:CR=1 FL=1|jgi:hypothetical protein|nr:MAG: F5/8 type C domain protein [Bacteroidetes bacterium ADurb.Bin028]HNZ77242.1 discoidin domain-containing protein [Bacilli bacterium]HOE15178.1 discoidin domain-containing protein [Candidatus Paceibacterota bacterium]HPL02066.1 discoidin domain-containing protein [Bacteroidales bacterium]HQL11809.1 discoidin domain-containing protein [bacterium]
MKILNLSYQLEKYSVDINNCIDYNIAETISFFKNEFFDYYNCFWTLYSNYYEVDISRIKYLILNIFGLEFINENIENPKDLINKIKQKIDFEHPIIINVPNSVLFYSIMYKNETVKSFNHSIIINGYDENLEVIYIRENSINTEVLSQLTLSQPFSKYILTNTMIENIFIEMKKLFSKDEIEKNFFNYIVQKNKIDIIDIKTRLVQEILLCFGEREDILTKELDKTIIRKYYHNYYRTEEFRRIILHSFKPLFDEIRKMLTNETTNEFDLVVNSYIRFKESIVNMLAKNSFKSAKVNEKKIKQIKATLKEYHINIYQLLSSKIGKNENLHNKYNLIKGDVQITSDSELVRGTKIFNVKNILTNSRSNDNLHFWISDNTMERHWVTIDFLKKININKIVIKHRPNVKYITKNYRLLYSLDGTNWEVFKNVKNNNYVVNEFLFNKKIEFRYFKIIITKANDGIDYSARIQKIEFYNCD